MLWKSEKKFWKSEKIWNKDFAELITEDQTKLFQSKSKATVYIFYRGRYEETDRIHISFFIHGAQSQEGAKYLKLLKVKTKP